MEKHVTTSFMMEFYDRPVLKNSIDSTNKLYRKLITVLKDSSGITPKFTIHSVKIVHDDYCQDINRLNPEVVITTENEKKTPLTQIDVQSLITNTISSIFSDKTEYPECDKVKCTVFNTSTNESVVKIFNKSGKGSQLSESFCMNGSFSSFNESTREFGQFITSMLSADNIKVAINDFFTLKTLVTDVLQTIKK